MKADIIKIIKDNAAIRLADMIVINPIDVSDKIESHIKKYIEWQNTNDLEYYSFEKRYEIWKSKR
jgi:hypothetical protein